MTDGRIEEKRAVVTPSSLVGELMRCSTALNAVLARRMELSVSDLVALHQLVGRSEVGPVELGSLLGMSSASATVLADRLQRAGYVRRRPAEGDRRRRILDVTPETAVRSSAAVAEWIEAVTEIEEEMTPEELAVVEKYLLRLLSAVTDFVERPGSRP